MEKKIFKKTWAEFISLSCVFVKNYFYDVYYYLLSKISLYILYVYWILSTYNCASKEFMKLIFVFILVLEKLDFHLKVLFLENTILISILNFYISKTSLHVCNMCWFFITRICTLMYLRELIFVKFIEIYWDLIGFKKIFKNIKNCVLGLSPVDRMCTCSRVVHVVRPTSRRQRDSVLADLLGWPAIDRQRALLSRCWVSSTPRSTDNPQRSNFWPLVVDCPANSGIV